MKKDDRPIEWNQDTTEMMDTIIKLNGPKNDAQADGFSSGSDSPQPRIGLLQNQQRPRFSDETENLLRGRLKAAAIDLIVVLGLGFVGNSLAGNFQWLPLRVLILGSVIGSFILLRSRAVLRTSRLRLIEAILFGGVAIQMALMMFTRINAYAEAGDSTSMHSAADFFVAVFCLHILTYGIFMPNSWKRAAVVMTLFAVIPYAVWYLLVWQNPEVAQLAKLNRAGWPIPVPFVAALIGTWGSHIIHRTRREAFQARQILQYRLGTRIGSGGMGDVYRAEHILLKRPCAIKLIKTENAGDRKTLDLFEREVVATARLSHWNTIDIYDYGHTDDGTFFYVMELLNGDSLQSLVDRHGPLPAERVAWILAQVCDALQEAHDVGLIHRDIKPANIFVTQRGGMWDVAKLLDFGLVREVKTEVDPEARKTGFSGTPSFMAPEQAQDYESVDARADLYALGAVAYYALTGKSVFVANSLVEMLFAHACHPVVLPSQRGFAVPPDLEMIIARCLEKVPDDRYPSARDLAVALRSIECANQWNLEKASQWWTARQAPNEQARLDSR